MSTLQYNEFYICHIKDRNILFLRELKIRLEDHSCLKKTRIIFSNQIVHEHFRDNIRMLHYQNKKLGI